MLRVAAVFSDHMVLQRERPIVVFGEADAPVTATLGDTRAEAAPMGQRFRLELPPRPAGGPFELTVMCGDDGVTFSDVMVGEVWLCGGQSNMEFRLKDGKDGAKEVAGADDGLLRFYTVNEEAEVDDAMLARERETAWKPLTPGACGDVSAVAFYAGRRLREALGVAVGMLICCVGGTEASNWISEETLKTFPEGRVALADFDRACEGTDADTFRRENAEYMGRVDVWCAASDAMKRDEPNIKAEAIVAQIGDFPWPPPVGPGMMRHPGNLWHTMTSRIVPYGAMGLFWYQGETDALNPGGYDAMFSKLIEEWRRGFENDDLFVVAAQLPNYGADPANENWPAIRASQQRVCDGTRRCALACLLDCGESGDIHPWDKRRPGRRLADLALRHAYGLDVQADAPRLEAARAGKGIVRLRFSEPLAKVQGDLRSLIVNGLPAKARVEEGLLVIGADAPAHVEYALENDPAACLFGESGLPVFPFEINVEG